MHALETWFRRGFVGVGVLSLLMTAGFWWSTAGFARRAERTTGTVVAFDPPLGAAWRGSYHPLVAFRPAQGDSVTFRHTAGSQPPSYDVGEQVPVWYDPADTRDARIVHSWWSLYFLPLLFAGFGALFILLGWWAVPALLRRAAPPVPAR